ncbi:MAG TPA: hypothetical protein VKG84_09380 [Candidatus Acidoferrales bacterium]|nr:hypothetical protein [Candidatus Acidoferrales bacterium]
MLILRWHKWLRGGSTRALATLIATAILLSSPPLRGYDKHLTENDVREAYFFGQRHDQSVGQFFNRYERKTSGEGSDPHVRAIGIRTPYSSVVLRSYGNGNTYHEQRAQRDYAAKANLFEVAVWVNVPFDFPVNPKDPSLSRAANEIAKLFKVELTQGETAVPVKFTMPALPEAQTEGGNITGVQIYIEYDVRDVASAPAHVRVTGPEGLTAAADFDLSTLR